VKWGIARKEFSRILGFSAIHMFQRMLRGEKIVTRRILPKKTFEKTPIEKELRP
jgi:hypothetical protein